MHLRSMLEADSFVAVGLDSRLIVLLKKASLVLPHLGRLIDHKFMRHFHPVSTPLLVCFMSSHRASTSPSHVLKSSKVIGSILHFME